MKRTVVLIVAGMLASQVAWAQPAGSVEQELMRLAQASLDAALKKDRAALERLYADDYVYIHSNGVVQARPQEIAEMMSGDVKWTSDIMSDMKVRVFGDAAVVTGLETLQGTAKGYVPGPRRVTDIWVKRNGRWQQLGGQTTIVAPTNAQDTATALSAVKVLTPKTLTPKNADERAVLAAEQANVAAELANDDTKSRALQAKNYSFVSRAGVSASPNDPPGPQIKSVTIAYDSLQAIGALTVIRGSLLWTDVKGFSPGVLRFMRVWVKQGNEWKLAAEQRTPIAATRPMSN